VTTPGEVQTMSNGLRAVRDRAGKLLALILTAILLLFFAVPFSFNFVAWRVLAVVALIWAALATLIIAGAEGREEAQRIIERPFDERERTIRTNALAIGLATVVLFNLGWVAYGIAAGTDALVPALTILLSGASFVIAVEVLRRRGMAPALGDDAGGAPVEAGYLAEPLGRPTWTATVIAWFLAVVVSTFLGQLFTWAFDSFGIPQFVLVPDAGEHIGAVGLGADVALLLFAAAVSAIQTFVFCLVASRWLNRSVSFLWLFAFSAVGLVPLALGIDFETPWSWAVPLAFAVLSLFVLRYLAAGTVEARGLASRLRLTPLAIGALSITTVLGLTVAGAFGTTHPLSVELDEGGVCCNALHGLPPESVYSFERYSPDRLDLRDSVTHLDFHTHNRGVADLKNLRITGIESSPGGAARIRSIRPGRGFYDQTRFNQSNLPPTNDGLLTESLPSHKQKAMKLRIKFDCSGPQPRVVTLTGLKFQYEAWGREWDATVPMDKLIVTCPR
jgi:hypothetical protein